MAEESTRGRNQSSRGLGMAPPAMARDMEDRARTELPEGAYEEALRVAMLMADQGGE